MPATGSDNKKHGPGVLQEVSTEFFAAVEACDASAVAHYLSESSDLARTKGGPQSWEPLVYACFGKHKPRVETARVLLRHGADTNAGNPLPCLYGACGVNNDAALGRVLLEAGAKPDDGESLYHSTEHPDLTCVRLLLEYGASPAIGVNHMLDREDAVGLRLLLDAGAEARGALRWAVYRERSLDIVGMLLDHGVPIDAKGEDGRTAYALAVRTGQHNVAELLRRRGADTAVSPVDELAGRIVSSSGEILDREIANAGDMLRSDEAARLIPELTMAHKTSSVRTLLAAEVRLDGRGELGATALHWACWKGYADLVQLLLDSGAPTDVREPEHHATPSEWFGHGVNNCEDRSGDYAGTARLLLQRGLKIPEVDMPTGIPEVDAVLREFRIIV